MTSYVQSVSPPQSLFSGTVQAPFALRPGLFPEKIVTHQGNYKGNTKGKRRDHPLLRLRRCHEGWGG